MAKLSRKEKYQNLRDSLEQESEPQVTPKQVRSPRMAAPDFKTDQKARGPVIEDLLGEVKQYNLDNGELVTDDTQMQILHDLSSQEQAAARRSVHFETMEQDEEIGGTTRNFYGSDLSSFMTNQATGRSGSSSSRSRQPKVNQTQSKKVQSEEPDFLDLFAPGQSSETSEPMVEVVEEDQEKTKEKPILFNNNRRKRRKAQRQANQIESSQEDLEKTLDNQSLEELFSTAQVAVKDSYFMEEDDGPELPFTKRSAPSQDYQEPVEEDFEEEEVSTNPMASFFQKFQRKKQESSIEEEENEIYQEEVPVVQPKKAKPKQNGTQTKSAKQTKSSQTTKKTTNKGTQSQDNSQSVNSAAVIFMVVCCVILLLLILLTIFFMSKLGIF